MAPVSGPGPLDLYCPIALTNPHMVDRHLCGVSGLFGVGAESSPQAAVIAFVCQSSYSLRLSIATFAEEV